MKDVMIDIETLGTRAYSVVTVIAAVIFDIETGEIGEIFEKKISIDDSLRKGLRIDWDMIKWWMGQDKNVIGDSVLFEKGERVRLSLLALHNFFRINFNFPECTDYRVWGNPVSFDLGLIKNMYDKICNCGPSWRRYQEMDLKTLSVLRPEIKKAQKNIGVSHNAVDDCRYQIAYLVKIWKSLNEIYSE